MESILAKDYADRKIIVVGPDDRSDAEASAVNWTGLGAFAGAGLLLGPVNPLNVYLLGKAALDWYRSKNKPEEPGVMLVPRSAAAAELVFPAGHPQVDCAYAGHPLVHRSYFPLGDFHIKVFEEKVNELIDLLAALKAKRVRIMHRAGFTQAANFDLSVPIPTEGPPVDVGAKASAKRKREQFAYFEETYRPQGEPIMPAGGIWLPVEPTWRALAKRRIEANTSTFKTTLDYTDDFGINASISAKVEGYGVKLGADLTTFESTRWEIEGEFL